MKQYRIRRVEGQNGIPDGSSIEHYFTKCIVCEKEVPLEDPTDILDVYGTDNDGAYRYKMSLGIVCCVECQEMAILQNI